MKWEEVDLEEGIWIIPATRMKMGIEHRVPMSKQAIALLERQGQGTDRDPDSYVFPGHKRGMPLSQMAMTMMLRRMKLGHFTVHGMRSAFRDYMGEMTDHPETVVEQALAHQVGDATVRAYRRGDAFLKRRLVMRDWANFLDGVEPPGRYRQLSPDKTATITRSRRSLDNVIDAGLLSSQHLESQSPDQGNPSIHFIREPL